MQPQASVKCMMEGCRTMVPAESEVCDVCRRKQMEAYERRQQHTDIVVSLYTELTTSSTANIVYTRKHCRKKPVCY